VVGLLSDVVGEREVGWTAYDWEAVLVQGELSSSPLRGVAVEPEHFRSSAGVVVPEERKYQPHDADRDVYRSSEPDGTEQALRAIGNAVLRDPCQPDADPGGEHEGARGGLDRRDQREDRAADDEQKAPVDAPVARDERTREPVRERHSPTPLVARSAAPASGSSRHVCNDAPRPDTIPLCASSAVAAMARCQHHSESVQPHRRSESTDDDRRRRVQHRRRQARAIPSHRCPLAAKDA
jgi:hypothetical protein